MFASAALLLLRFLARATSRLNVSVCLMGIDN